MRSSSVICFSISILSTFSEIGLSFPEFMIYNKNQKDNENRADFGNDIGDFFFDLELEEEGRELSVPKVVE